MILSPVEEVDSDTDTDTDPNGCQCLIFTCAGMGNYRIIDYVQYMDLNMRVSSCLLLARCFTTHPTLSARRFS